MPEAVTVKYDYKGSVRESERGTLLAPWSSHWELVCSLTHNPSQEENSPLRTYHKLP